MGRITSGTGLISGINTTDIINQLMSLESRPVTLLQTRIATATAQQQAYTDLSTKISSIKTIGMSLELPSSFVASSSTSSDQSVLTATAGPGAALGTYQFQVARLVSAQQSISNGYASGTSLVGAGTITVSLGGGDLNAQTPLSQLNGGNGVQRGTFRITDRSGHTGVIDISSAVSLDDAVKKINTSLDVSVHASITDGHLTLQDISGQTTSNLTVQDLSGGSAAADLGIVGTSTDNSLVGTDIDQIGLSTATTTLNDGRGIGSATGGAADFRATLADGSSIDVTLAGSQTVGDVLKAINIAGGTKLKATLDTTNNSIKLTDSTAGGGSLSVSALNNSTAVADLGLNHASSGGVIGGNTILAGLDTVLLSSLQGGAGLSLGKISIKNRSGASTDVDLTGQTTLAGLLDKINQSGADVTASLNNSGNGIQIQDNTGGSGDLVIGDVTSTTAQALGIKGTFDTNTTIVAGSNQHFQWVSNNSLLSKYNGGKGVTPGSFRITNSKGVSATVDLSQGTFTNLGDVITAINSKSIGVTASINANGNGLLLTDNLNGSTKLTVANLTGTTASDLNIAGTATTNTIDGSFEKTISVSATDTLTDVQAKVQNLNWGVIANLVNDGSGANGYHLSLTATNSGRAGRVVIDGGTTSLQARNLVSGQDAAVFLGGGDGSQSLLVTSSTNQVTGVIPGVTVQLNGASANPVTVNITRDSSNILKNLQDFTTGFNDIVDTIGTLTQWDSTKNQGGLLLGESAVQNVQSRLYTVFNDSVTGAGTYRTLGDIGMTLGDGGKITFDSDKFQAAFAADPVAVKNLFTQAQTGLGTIIDKSTTSLVDPVIGSLTQENTTITNKIQQFNDQITSLNSILTDKRNRLEEQFSNMETVLAGLQSQQTALASLSSSTTKAA